MKALTLLLLILAPAAAAHAQKVPGYPEAPGMAVLKNEWGVRTRNASPDQDPLAASREKLARDKIRQDEDTRRAGGTIVGDTPRMSTFRRPPPAPVVEHFFEATVRNTGNKTIRRLIWEYVFFDRETGAEVGYRAFRYESDIKPGKTAKLEGLLPIAPGGAADAARVAKAAQGRYVERIFFRRIEYDDYTTWERARPR